MTDAVRQAAVVLDHEPDLADAVLRGELALDAACAPPSPQIGCPKSSKSGQRLHSLIVRGEPHAESFAVLVPCGRLEEGARLALFELEDDDER